MIVNLTPEQRAAVKKWAELREKHPKKTRDEILAAEDNKSKAKIFEIEEKAFGVAGRENGLGTSDLESLRLRTKIDKEKYL